MELVVGQSIVSITITICCISIQFSVCPMDPQGPTSPSQVGRPTLKSGAPVGDKFNSLMLGAKGPHLLADTAYLEETAHFNRERIPERVVHAKGIAALGVFEVTKTDICKYSKASLFDKIGKTTPVATRFSNVVGETGHSDTVRDVRGFAVKFYTDQGNWDLVGNNLPVFFIRDPINFTSFIHSQKRNPQTHLKDPDAFWDFVAQLPETIHTILMLFSERGIPNSPREMHGFGVNTFKLVNSKRQAYYAKFHWICDQGIKNLDQVSANKIAGLDPDHFLRDLLDNIAKGNFPSWTLKFQVMTVHDAQKAKFNVLDVTKTWPHSDFPLIEIGKMTLNRNVDNFHAQVEQLAYSPANMVPGIEPSPDRMLVGRMMSYPDAQRYRLGANYADLPSNRPACPVVTPTYCDNVTFNTNYHGRVPNYMPSVKYKRYDGQFLEHEEQFTGHTGRFDLSEDDNFTQPKVFYTKILNDDSKRALASNIADHLALVINKEVVARVLGHMGNVDQKLVKDIEGFMMMKSAKL